MTRFVNIRGYDRPVAASKAILIYAKAPFSLAPRDIALVLGGAAKLSSIYTRLSQARSRGVSIPKFHKWA